MANHASPKGLARFSKLVEADFFKDKWTYNTDLIIDPSEPEAAAAIASLQKIADEAFAEVKADLQKKVTDARNGADAKKAQKALDDVELHPVIHDLLDRESGEPTGKMFLKFKTQANDKQGNRKHLRFFDAKGAPFKPTGELGFGSVIRVNYSTNHAYVQNKVFLTLYINGVQVISMSGAGGSAEDMGFGSEEGGFDSSDVNGDFGASGQTEEVSVGADGTGADY